MLKDLWKKNDKHELLPQDIGSDNIDECCLQENKMKEAIEANNRL